MALQDLQAFDRMVRQGVNIMKLTPAISRADFLTALALTGPFVNADWQIEEALLESLAYVAAASNFNTHRTFWVATNNNVERNIRAQLSFEASTAVSARIAFLKAQRDDLQAQRDVVRDLIQNVLMPWLNAPTAGTPAEVIDAVQERVQALRNQRDILTRSVDYLSAQITGLGG